jgi:hypothetical protein
MRARLNDEKIHLSCGASFFILSNEKGNQASVNLVDVGSFGLINDSPEIITKFLNSNNLSTEEIDLVLYSNSDQKKTYELKLIFGDREIFDYQKITGTYFTNAAFAMHYGIDILLQRKHSVFGEGLSKVLVCNNLIPENLGLILLDNKRD